MENKKQIEAQEKLDKLAIKMKNLMFDLKKEKNILELFKLYLQCGVILEECERMNLKVSLSYVIKQTEKILTEKGKLPLQGVRKTSTRR